MKKNASFPKRSSDISFTEIKISQNKNRVNIVVQPYLPDFECSENPIAPILHSPLRKKVLKYIQNHGKGRYTSLSIAKNLGEFPGRVSAALYALKMIHGLVNYHREGNNFVVTDISEGENE